MFPIEGLKLALAFVQDHLMIRQLRAILLRMGDT
jgi:hypothetical protein